MVEPEHLYIVRCADVDKLECDSQSGIPDGVERLAIGNPPTNTSTLIHAGITDEFFSIIEVGAISADDSDAPINHENSSARIIGPDDGASAVRAAQISNGVGNSGNNENGSRNSKSQDAESEAAGGRKKLCCIVLLSDTRVPGMSKGVPTGDYNSSLC